MNFGNLRVISRDSVFYDLLCDAMMTYCNDKGLGSYSKYFSGVVGYTSKNAHVEFSACLVDDSYFKLSVDELQKIFRELGSYGTAAINRFLDTTGLYVSSVGKSDVTVDTFPALHLIYSGSLVRELTGAISDDSISNEEKRDILASLFDLQNFLSTFCATFGATFGVDE